MIILLGEENVLSTIIMITTIQGRNKLVHYYTTRWQNFLCHLRYLDLYSYKVMKQVINNTLIYDF